MAKPMTSTATQAANRPANPAKPTVSKAARKEANLLREASTCYRDAATALLKDDVAAYNAALDLALKYLALVMALGREANVSATAEALESTQAA